MKKPNILLLTALYPSDDISKAFTPVVHYFAREWVESGYPVNVIHYPYNFPKLLFFLCKPFRKRLISKFGTEIRTSQIKGREYEIEGVKVKRIPLLKSGPHKRYSEQEIDKAFRQTVEYLENTGFVPDVIISHWINPQVEIMDRLKRKYNVPTCLVTHDSGFDFKKIYSEQETEHFIKNIDIIGFRSDFIKKNFMRKFPYVRKSFQCYSGIPEKYVSDETVNRDFDRIKSFIYVGALIKRKFPAAIIPAVKGCYGDEDFRITYVGEGSEKANILKEAKKNGVEDKVVLTGYIPRDSIVKLLKEHDLLVMISKRETFGLVYLEAMAVGCIPIASRKEGFDGIIQHGVNGFLCASGDAAELEELIGRIRKMPPEELKVISANAIQTAKRLTDKKAAREYLDNVLSCMETEPSGE